MLCPPALCPAPLRPIPCICQLPKQSMQHSTGGRGAAHWGQAHSSMHGLSAAPAPESGARQAGKPEVGPEGSSSTRGCLAAAAEHAPEICSHSGMRPAQAAPGIPACTQAGWESCLQASGGRRRIDQSVGACISSKGGNQDIGGIAGRRMWVNPAGARDRKRAAGHRFTLGVLGGGDTLDEREDGRGERS